MANHAIAWCMTASRGTFQSTRNSFDEIGYTRHGVVAGSSNPVNTPCLLHRDSSMLLLAG
jgi:hypothetical protein